MEWVPLCRISHQVSLASKTSSPPAGSLPFHYELWKDPSNHKSSKRGMGLPRPVPECIKPLAGFLTLPTAGFVKLNFPPSSQEAVPVLHIKNYALSSRITCLC